MNNTYKEDCKRDKIIKQTVTKYKFDLAASLERTWRGSWTINNITKCDMRDISIKVLSYALYYVVYLYLQTC